MQKENLSDTALLSRLQSYCREVADEHEMDVDFTRINWEVSRRLRRAGGKCVYHPDGTQTIRIARRQYEEHGLEASKKTAVHEMVHAFCEQEYGKRARNHGYLFKRHADPLPTTRRCERFDEDYKFIVFCTECDWSMGRFKRSKTVTNPEKYRCPSCGADPLDSRRA